MTRVLHTGDTHIGYRQYHSPERQADFLAAFRHVIEDAIEDEVDAVVHAGDLFHDRQPALDDVHGTIEILRELRAADIPLFAVVGNHERTRGRQWLDLFETLGLAVRLGRAPHVVGEVALYGLDFVPRSRRPELEYDFAPHDADHAALVAHGLFEPFAHADWETERVLRESTVDFDALLLGDNHTPGVETVADTWVTYCGSTERTDATERAERGYNLVTFDGEVTVSRRGLETRPFVAIDLELAAGEGAERVRERLREERLEDAVVVVTLTGDGETVTPAEIEAFADEQGALVARVLDRREFEADEVPEVRFADPDQAVRDRLREMGLSEAARGIDATVRGLNEVADSNVREVVTEHVREHLEEDPGALESAAATEPASEARTAAVESSAEAPLDGGPTADRGAPTAADDGAVPPDEPGEDPVADPPTEDESGVSASTPPRESTGEDDVGDDADRQVTMEDYL